MSCAPFRFQPLGLVCQLCVVKLLLAELLFLSSLGGFKRLLYSICRLS